jgi:alpha-tubulin suppressor-like RCC1 family protein
MNDHGQLGLGQPAAAGGVALGAVVDLGGRKAQAVTAGRAHTCVIFRDDTVACWGASNHQQLGANSGDTRDRGDTPSDFGATLPIVKLDAKVRELAAGGDTTCALLQSGAVRCWGANDQGQLGRVGDANLASAEANVPFPSPKGTANRIAHHIAVGGVHACAILDDQSLHCWGWNEAGQLGLGRPFNGSAVPDKVGVGSVAAVAAGAAHTCAILTNGTARCWGENSDGQLALGDDKERGKTPATAGKNLKPLDFAGGAVQVLATGWNHTCAIGEEGATRCWGENFHGQLGLGDVGRRGMTADSDILQNVVDAGDPLVTLALGEDHSCAITAKRAVKCRGSNEKRQLGSTDSAWHGAVQKTMGEELPIVDLN